MAVLYRFFGLCLGPVAFDEASEDLLTAALTCRTGRSFRFDSVFLYFASPRAFDQTAA